VTEQTPPEQARLSVQINADVEDVLTASESRFGWGATETTRQAFSLLSAVLAATTQGRTLALIGPRGQVTVLEMTGGWTGAPSVPLAGDRHRPRWWAPWGRRRLRQGTARDKPSHP
jgi:hypothetical protein